jgi:hypothetical protein
MKPFSLLLFALLPLCFSGLYSQSFSNGYPWQLPNGDSSTQVFLPHFPADPIEAGEEISINSSGDFVKNGQPIRFWGVNITASGAFPEKSQAPAIAARMRKMGINLVRFHHLDNPWSGADGSLFAPGQGTRSLNSVTLDRLGFFLAALKAEGIYVNMNLNVSRTFSPLDGVLHADSLQDFAKAVTVFDPQLIALQQEFADQLLTYDNPYTGLPLKADPLLAMVEIINENSIYGYWKGDRLQPQARGGALIQRHNDMLDSLWTVFLQNKYATQTALESAWNIGSIPPGQNEQLQNGGFESGSMAPNWQLELHSTAQASIGISNSNPASGSFSGQVSISQTTGTDWHIQFKQSGMSVQKDSVYAIRFSARASGTRSLNISLMRDNSPYTWYSGSNYVLNNSWQEFVFTFVAPENNTGQTRLSFSFDGQPATYFFDEMSFADPSQQGLEAGEMLSEGNIRRLPYSTRLNYTPQRVADQSEFYVGLQQSFFQEMRAYLQGPIGLTAPLTGTNALVGPQDVLPQQDLDFVDDHSYWDHPGFPSVPWDPIDWYIGNQSLLRQTNVDAISNIFSGLALAGKPYTVSEYNHPFPNRYQTEMMPLLTAYASFHGADGLMIFEYNGNKDDWTAEHVGGFFGIHRNPAQMSLMPTSAYAYRNRLVSEAAQTNLLNYSPDWVWNSSLNDNQGRWGKYIPYDQRLALTHDIRTTGYQGTVAPDFGSLPSPGTSPYVSSSGEIELDTDKGGLLTSTPAYVSIAGFLPDMVPATAGDMRLNGADDFGVITWVALGGDSLRTAERSLLTISARAQNSSMMWNGTQTVNNNWGNAPTLMQALNPDLRLQVAADSLRIYPLDERGAVQDSFTIASVSPGRFRLSLDQSVTPTPWYGIRALGIDPSLNSPDLEEKNLVRLFPNPSQGRLTLEYTSTGTTELDLLLYDLRGRLLGTWHFPGGGTATVKQEINLPGLPAGLYAYQIRVGEVLQNGKLVVQP